MKRGGQAHPEPPTNGRNKATKRAYPATPALWERITYKETLTMPQGPAPAAAKPPGLFAKGSLTVGKGIERIVGFPDHLNTAALTMDQAIQPAAEAAARAFVTGYDSLQPRGPAKWIEPFMLKLASVTVAGKERAARNEEKFWGPMAKSSAAIADGLGTPFAAGYAKSAGFPDPFDRDVIHVLLRAPFKAFPGPALAEAIAQAKAAQQQQAQPQAQPQGSTDAQQGGQAAAPPAAT